MNSLQVEIALEYFEKIIKNTLPNEKEESLDGTELAVIGSDGEVTKEVKIYGDIETMGAIRFKKKLLQKFQDEKNLLQKGYVHKTFIPQSK